MSRASGRAAAAALAIVVLAGLAAGCGDDADSDASAPPGSQPAASQPPQATAPATTATSAGQDTAGQTGSAQACAPGSDGTYGLGSQGATLQPGCYGAYVLSADPAAGTVTFDLVQFFVGEQAVRQAAAQDGRQTDFLDFSVRNTNTQQRTMPLAPDATITVNLLQATTGGSATDVAVDVERLASLLRTERGRYRPAPGPLVWLDVQDGRITSFREQFQS
jgi:hypothetical protein